MDPLLCSYSSLGLSLSYSSFFLAVSSFSFASSSSAEFWLSFIRLSCIKLSMSRSRIKYSSSTNSSKNLLAAAATRQSMVPITCAASISATDALIQRRVFSTSATAAATTVAAFVVDKSR